MVSDKMYRRMQLSCSCGHVSRNMGEEARHRHNFPAYCNPPLKQCEAVIKDGKGCAGVRRCKVMFRGYGNRCRHHMG